MTKTIYWSVITSRLVGVSLWVVITLQTRIETQAVKASHEISKLNSAVVIIFVQATNCTLSIAIRTILGTALGVELRVQIK